MFPASRANRRASGQRCRGTEAGFIPGPGNLVDQTASPVWRDSEYDGWEVYYKVIVVDSNGNESLPASPGTVTGDDDPEIPLSFVLHQNVPNPFNPSTTIRFGIDVAGRVTLRIYDVAGRLVKELVNDYRAADRYEEVWDGRDNRGNPVASGVYFYSLETGRFEKTRKMLLLR